MANLYIEKTKKKTERKISMQKSWAIRGGRCCHCVHFNDVVEEEKREIVTLLD